MSTTICTLFEGHYHLGAAALINSLHASGFHGRVVCGLRGPLPPWSEPSREGPGDVRIRQLGEIEICFLRLTTDVHLTNYKPDFMLSQIGPDTDVLWYLDPDIVVTAPWSVFADWTKAGLALCEDVNSPLSVQHPRRVGWRQHFATKGYTLQAKESFYVNGGCLGLPVKYRSFLELWRNLQLAMSDAIGGLAQSKLSGGTSDRMRDPHFCFNASDQDALNAAIEAAPADVPFSILGAAAMGFKPGACILPHALGSPKPWTKAYLREAFRGHAPSMADKAFWHYASGPIPVFAGNLISRRKLTVKIAALIGRFYRRS